MRKYYINRMKRKHNKQFSDVDNRIIDYQYSWTEPNVLKERNRNSTLCFAPTDNHPFSKRLFLANKTINSKIHSLPLQKDDSFLRVQQLTTQYKAFYHARKRSNIQLLKKEIQYLQQQSLTSQQFPKNDKSYEFITKNGQKPNEQKKSLFFTREAEDGGTEVIKGFIGGPLKCVSTHSEQKLKRKWLKSNKHKKQASENKQNEQIKTFCKYQLMVPYRKYFPASRFRKNRSITMKVDEIMGRRVTKLANFSIQKDLK